MCDGGSASWAAFSQIASDLPEVGDGPWAISDLHLRKRAKAASSLVVGQKAAQS